VVVQQFSQTVGAQQVHVARIVREGDGALFGGWVEATVTNEVEDVPGTASHGPLQVALSLSFEPG
jgi:hypothetical protein